LKQLHQLYPDNLKNEKPLTIGIIAGYRGQYRVVALKYTEQHYHRVLACIELLYVVFSIMLLRYFADVYSVYEK
jgi:hypothetical protein